MNYWTRLKGHPGLSTAFLMTILCGLAALSNANLTFAAALFVWLGSAVVIWSIVLASNRLPRSERRKKRKRYPKVAPGKIFSVDGKLYIITYPTNPSQQANGHGQMVLEITDATDE